MCMLKERNDLLREGTPDMLPSYFFNSFFMERLMILDNGYTYNNVRRWTKKIDVFAHEKVRHNIRTVSTVDSLGIDGTLTAVPPYCNPYVTQSI